VLVPDDPFTQKELLQEAVFFQLTPLAEELCLLLTETGETDPTPRSLGFR
jgi:hypothetical protein